MQKPIWSSPQIQKLEYNPMRGRFEAEWGLFITIEYVRDMHDEEELINGRPGGVVPKGILYYRTNPDETGRDF